MPSIMFGDLKGGFSSKVEMKPYKEFKMSSSRNMYTYVGSGWHSFVKPLEDWCKANGVVVVQVKEKFGTLRFYTNSGALSDKQQNELYGWIAHAEEMSELFCEKCGDTAYRDGKYWIKTYCTNHHNEIL